MEAWMELLIVHLDDLRAAFGAETIDAAIRASMARGRAGERYGTELDLLAQTIKEAAR